MISYDIVVVGSGPGGYVAAIRAAQLGFKTAVVERAELGGICLNWGCIPTKALLKSAEVFSHVKHAAQYGVVAQDFKPDMAAIVARSRGVAETMSKGIAYLLNKNKVDVVAGEGRVKPGKQVEVRLNDGGTETLEAKHIILATGARSRQVPALPQDGLKIIGYREALVLDRLPARMVVVGSGAIGSEFAHFYQSLGTQVTLIEFMPSVVPVEDADVSAQLARCFKKNGMKVLTGTTVEKVDTTGEGCKVYVSSKKGEEVIETDIVLSAVGVVTNVENIGLEECGIAVERGKVQVDEYYRTSVEGYYAIGDIVPGQALAHVASHEALICVEHIAGLNPKPLDYGKVPGCTYTTPEVASIGLNEQKATEAGYELKIGKFPFTASGKATAGGLRDGFVKVIFDAKTDKMLGCHLIGDHVTEMIGEALMIMEKGITGPEIIHAVHPHPSMSEGLMEAVAIAYGECVHV